MFNKKPAPQGTDAKTIAPVSKGEAKPSAESKPEKKGMFSFGKKKATAAPGAKPGTSVPAPSPEMPDPIAILPSRPPKKKGGSPLKLLFPILLILVLGAGGYYVYTNFVAGGALPGPEASSAIPVPTDVPPARLSDAQPSLSDSKPLPTPKRVVKKPKSCAGTPKFFARLKLPADAKFSTNEPDTRGIVLLAPVENSDAVSKYQHQSWNRAGFMDAFVIDQNGSVYVAPSPRTGLGVAKPAKQDHVFKLDTNSGELKDMLALPSAAPVSPENPYGVLGLALDCDTNSLYVTTVTGSTADSQVGQIYRIDLASGEVAGKIENLDGYGVAVRVTANGKQLVFGSARDNKLRAVDLDEAGNFQGEPREIAALEDSKRARQISFPNDTGMVVNAVEFTFAKTGIPEGSNVNFQYDAAGDKWSIAQ